MNDTLFSNACAIVVNRVCERYKISTTTPLAAELLSYAVKGKCYIFNLKIAERLYTATYTFSSNVILQGTLEITTDSSSDIYSIQRVNDAFRIYVTAFDYDELFFVNNDKLVVIRITKQRKQCVSCMSLQFSNKHLFTIINVIAYAKPKPLLTGMQLQALFIISGATEYDITKCRDVVCFCSTNLDMLIYTGATNQIISIVERTNKPGNQLCGAIKILNSDFHQQFTYETTTEGLCWIVEFEHDQQNNTNINKRVYSTRLDGDIIVVPQVGDFQTTQYGNDIFFIKKLQD